MSQTDSRAQTLEILERLRDGYPTPPDIGKNTWRVYVNALCDVPLDTLRAASVLLVKTSRFFPSIAEIKTACLEVSSQGALLPTAGEAFAEARRAAGRIGAYSKPVAEDFSHALVHRAALQAAGSWRRWCLSEDEAPLRARFFECFRELLARELRQQALPESQRQLSAEESRQILEDIEAKAARQGLLPIGRSTELRPIHELKKTAWPFPEGEEHVVGAELTDEEWERRKAELTEKL